MFVCGVPAQKYWDEGYESWEEPGRSYHSHRRVGIHEVIIVKRLADRVKPVDNALLYCLLQCCMYHDEYRFLVVALLESSNKWRT